LKFQEKVLNFVSIYHRIVRVNIVVKSVSGKVVYEAMLNIVLVEPEIPQNTGNIARTCAATGAVLHLIEPLGFDISASAVKRAGLDYWNLVDVRVYSSLEDFFQRNPVEQMRLFSTKAPRSYTEADYGENCYLLFGKETKGLPEAFLAEHYEDCVRIPMREEARSLNLSNSVAVAVFEALRQQNFPHLKDHGKMKE
jgi:tRNA (cytidine/uridine-2'-O-)-methyltransferase